MKYQYKLNIKECTVDRKRKTENRKQKRERERFLMPSETLTNCVLRKINISKCLAKAGKHSIITKLSSTERNNEIFTGLNIEGVTDNRLSNS